MALAASSEGAGMNPMSFTDQHGSIVLERMRYQRETGRFCDVCINVMDRNFAAHRNILASCSPYFDSIFKSTKVTKELVTVNCNNPNAFELLLNYMYSGCVVIDRSTVSELLRLANNFLVTKLKNYCAEYLDRYLDAANCLSVRVLASRYNLPPLLKAATEYFDVNINRCLLESVDILEYPMSKLVEIIEEPKYQDVISPDVHLKLISRWVGKDVAGRESSFRTLISSCPICDVSESALEFLLDYSPLYSNSPRARFLLLNSMRENDMSLDKYTAQYNSLCQQLGGQEGIAEQLNVGTEFGDSGSSGEEEDYDEEAPVDGHPTTSQILETFEDVDGVERPRLKLKISLGAPLHEPFKRRHSIHKKRGMHKRKRKEHRDEDRDYLAMIPMQDDDEVDGVYATASLQGAVLYEEEDFLDPDEVDPGEDHHVEGGNYRCQHCKFSCTLDEDLEKHRARAHNRNTLYRCQLCDFECVWSKQFYEHCREAHWTNRPYQCDQCEFVAPEALQDLLSHRLTHTDDRFFKCLECGYAVRSRTQLWAHERMHSSLDDRPVHCKECGRGYTDETALEAHSATHNQPRQHICEDCGFASMIAEGIASHRRQHTGDIFKCHIGGCDYSSPKKSQLAAHLRTHMAVRAHMCKVCGRGFIEKSHLVRHERIHLEDKPFKCDACEYASSRRDKLKEHILKHHNGNANGTKAHRRRYRRAKLVDSIVAQQTRGPIPDPMFRPITASESVSQWAEQQSHFHPFGDQPHVVGAHPGHGDAGPSTSSSAFNGVASGVGAGTAQPPTGSGFSPQRALSATHPAPTQMAPMSPGSMSLMNVHLGGMDAPIVSRDVSLTQTMNTTPNLLTPIARTPQNQSAELFMGIGDLPSGDVHNRPMSLPPYGQQAQQQWW